MFALGPAIVNQPYNGLIRDLSIPNTTCVSQATVEAENDRQRGTGFGFWVDCNLLVCLNTADDSTGVPSLYPL